MGGRLFKERAMRVQYLKLSVVASFVILGIAFSPVSASGSTDRVESVEGSLLLAWGTPGAGEIQPKVMVASLRLDDGSRIDHRRQLAAQLL